MKPNRSWSNLDKQMAAWSADLHSKVGLSQEQSKKVATAIAAEIRFLPVEAKKQITDASPIEVNRRVEELNAFQAGMDIIRGSKPSPAIVRGQVIWQNYICFVYLPESCFNAISRYSPSESVSKKCATYLEGGLIRSFRNAIAHANWCYRDDFKGIVYWANFPDYRSPIRRFEVDERELQFWQTLSRCVAYAAFTNL